MTESWLDKVMLAKQINVLMKDCWKNRVGLEVCPTAAFIVRTLVTTKGHSMNQKQLASRTVFRSVKCLLNVTFCARSQSATSCSGVWQPLSSVQSLRSCSTEKTNRRSGWSSLCQCPPLSLREPGSASMFDCLPCPIRSDKIFKEINCRSAGAIVLAVTLRKGKASGYRVV